MERLEAIDQERLGEWARHAPFADAQERRCRRFYGVGGLGTATAVAASLLVAARLEVTALQAGLIGFGALLVGLALVRVAAGWLTRRVQVRVSGYCLDTGCSSEELHEVIKRLPHRWFMLGGILRASTGLPGRRGGRA